MRLVSTMLSIVMLLSLASCSTAQVKGDEPVDTLLKILDREKKIKTELSEAEYDQFQAENLIVTFDNPEAKEMAAKYYLASASVLMNAENEDDILKLGEYAESENVLLQYGVLLSLSRALEYYESYGTHSQYNKNFEHKKFYHEIVKDISERYQLSPDETISLCAEKTVRRNRRLHIPAS